MDNPSFIETEAERGGPKEDGLSQLQRRKLSNKFDETQKSEKEEIVALHKNIGFFSCVGILVGGIIGSGIFISPKGVLLGSGSIGLSLVIWLICGFVAMMGSLVFAELGTLLPNSGGQYFYMLAAFDPKRSERRSWKSLLPFLYFWQFNFFAKPAGTVVQGMACASYLKQLFDLSGCSLQLTNEEEDSLLRILAAAFILIITVINCHSTKLSTSVINVFTFIKLLAVFFVIITGLWALASGTNEGLKTGFQDTEFTPNGIVTAFYSGFWAYAGWDNLNLCTRELKNPKRDLIRSLVFTAVLITAVYMLANVAYFTVLSKETFLSSNAVAVDFADNIIGKTGAVYMIFSVSCSIFGSTFGGVFTSARMSYAAAREGHMIDVISFIHYQRMTPTVSITFSTFLSLIILPYSSILGLISLLGFIEWIFMFITMVALFILRKTTKTDEDSFKVPTFVPIIMMGFSLFLVVTPLVRNPQTGHIFAVLLILAGIIPYILCVYNHFRIPGLDKLTILIQKIMMVLPPEDQEI